MTKDFLSTTPQGGNQNRHQAGLSAAPAARPYLQLDLSMNTATVAEAASPLAEGLGRPAGAPSPPAAPSPLACVTPSSIGGSSRVPSLMAADCFNISWRDLEKDLLQQLGSGSFGVVYHAM